ncbi:Hpt domain-containing protein [Sphingomicrobium lutaoense]|uniref:HPt (Histidine-containing phosphotransfer) domain-containing protein n=1 Tax=Sphingomicrobium lutaoense TaxID=515949 RepID=A0A839Z457_9SPHN|nr:Hpt domain-containing protein [Sphingomicrobium lutaoense]MBB3764375.1 HPt (histidine-containing phosphotransfer) domain-containing protein [Sphingomicrobium lutaoense]
MQQGVEIIDWRYFEKARAELGPGFIRILGYFREDGATAVANIKAAMHAQDPVKLIIPSHTLKGESRQFGAEPLADVAEKIEMTARQAVEEGRYPDELVPDVVKLEQLFGQTVAAFDERISPLKRRDRPTFGQKAANTVFGRSG